MEIGQIPARARAVMAPALAAVALVAGGSGLMAETADAYSAGGTPTPHVGSGHPATPFEPLSSLPGYHDDVGSPQYNSLKGSTVKIMERGIVPGLAASQWLELCTGIKVDDPSSPLDDEDVLTAGHCLDSITSSETGVINLRGNSFGALNYFGLVPVEFAIVDPQAPTLERDNYPIATVTGISVDVKGVDMALLRTGPVNPAEQTIANPDERPFASIPALPLSSLAEQAPPRGSEVSLYTVPAASGFRPVSAVGRYLGTVMTSVPAAAEPAFQRPLRFIALNAKTPAEDACNYSASGSAGEDSNGQIVGDISTRLNDGYGPHHVFEPLDYPKEFVAAMKRIQRLLDVKILGHFNTLCGLVPPPAGIVATLEAGFNQPAQTDG